MLMLWQVFSGSRQKWNAETVLVFGPSGSDLSIALLSTSRMVRQQSLGQWEK
jgi:hypothetical protein